MANTQEGTTVAQRTKGSGSLYQRSDGRWVGSLEAGWTARGTRRRVVVTAKTKRETQDKLNAARKRIARDEMPAEGTGALTVAKWSTVWLEDYMTRVRPKTYSTDSSIVRKWIVPVLGKRRLADLAPADTRRLAAEVRGAGRSATTVRYVQSVLGRMLRGALAEGHHVPPAVLAARKADAAASDRGALPPADVVAIIRAAQGLPEGPSRWMAALGLGLRQAEALGLTWDRVDLGGGVLDVSWQAQSLPYRTPGDRGSGFRVPDGYEAVGLHDAVHLVRPKGRLRVVPILGAMRDELAVLPSRQAGGLVWPRTDGSGRTRSPGADRDEWYALQRLADVRPPEGRERWVVHEARHSAATTMRSAGYDEDDVRRVMGHSSVETTRGYAHAPLESRARTVEGAWAALPWA